MQDLLWIAIGLTFFALLEALVSLRGGFEFRAALRRASREEPPAFAPPATLIVPCRGLDSGFVENLRAFFALDYPDLQLLFVSGGQDDACVGAIQRLIQELPDRGARILFAGRALNRGQKVHNLLHAVSNLRERDEVIAFGDSDIRPDPLWLRGLVAGLEKPGTGAATGFRWYLPQRGNFASILRSVWNAGAVSLLKEKDSFFAWGGAMAMRREDFRDCRVDQYWDNALSDDLALSQAVHDQRKSIRFRPRALSFSHEDCSLAELLNWSRRQMVVLRVCHPRLWRLALTAQTINAAGLWGGLAALLVGKGEPGLSWSVLAISLGLVYALGCWKAWVRTRAVHDLFPSQAGAIRRHWWAYIFWTPLASLVSLLALIRSARSRDIEWRGIRYRMHAADRTEIL